MSSERVLIPEVVFLQEGPGVRKNQYTQSGVKLLNVANLVEGKVDLSTSNRYISEEEAYGKYKHFLVDEGDLIIASSGIKVEYFDKKMGFVDKSQLPLCMNTSTIRFKSLDQNKLNIRFFMYFLKSNDFKKQLLKQITGSAQLNFGPSHLSKMTLPLFDIKTQEKIYKKLDKIVTVISIRKQQLEQLDLLIKSRFVEMFGDVKANKFGWVNIKLSKIITNINNGMTRRGNDIDGNIVLRLVELQNGYIDYSSTNRIKLQDDEKQKFLLKENDFLFARVNGNPDYVGRCAVFSDVGEPVYHNDHIIRVHCDDSKLNGTFGCYFFNSEYGKSQIREYITTSAGQYTINQTGISSMYVVLPPLTLQNEFAQFVEQVEKSKTQVQKSLDEAQLLFNRLMQEYFE